jgi:hypothetical protein
VPGRKSTGLLALAAALLVLVACGGEDGTDAPDGGGDSAGQAACERYRDIAVDAFSETISESEVVAGLQEVGSLATEATDPAIRDNAAAAAEEGNASAMINGDPNPAQDALAEACNSAFPI